MSEQIFQRLEAHFGTTIHSWPRLPYMRARHWWQVAAKKLDARMDAAFQVAVGRQFTNDDCANYWLESIQGQFVNEDAGGYRWRCWSAALGLLDEESIGLTMDVAIAAVIARDIVKLPISLRTP